MPIGFPRNDEPCLKCAHLMTVRGTVNMPLSAKTNCEWKEMKEIKDYCLKLGQEAPMNKFLNMDSCSEFMQKEDTHAPQTLS